MSSIIVVEVCANGTITRACARTVNAQLRVLAKRGFTVEPVWSGASDASQLIAELEDEGIAVRVVDAAGLAGADKARHTRAVNKSRDAQARKAERKESYGRHAA